MEPGCALRFTIRCSVGSLGNQSLSGPWVKTNSAVTTQVLVIKTLFGSPTTLKINASWLIRRKSLASIMRMITNGACARRGAKARIPAFRKSTTCASGKEPSHRAKLSKLKS